MGRVLLLGAGSSRKRMVCVNDKWDWVGQELITLDIESSHRTDVVWDLNNIPWSRPRLWFKTLFAKPFEGSSFEEIHAYQLLEHLGSQGDAKSFFDVFYEAWRLLEPGGHFVGTTPMWNSMWALGDPGHRRVINRGSLVFLSQMEYDLQVGTTPMADYRSLWKGDFETVSYDESNENFAFILKAIKPARSY